MCVRTFVTQVADWVGAIDAWLPGGKYKKLATHQMVGIVIVVYIKVSLGNRVTNVLCSSVATGMMGTPPSALFLYLTAEPFSRAELSLQGLGTRAGSLFGSISTGRGSVSSTATSPRTRSAAGPVVPLTEKYPRSD